MQRRTRQQPHLANEYQSLSEVIGLEFDRITKMVKMAWRLYDEHNYREAAAVFRGLLLLEPENIEIYRGHALAAAQDSDLLTAIETLDKGIFLLEMKPERKADLGYLLALAAALLYRSGRRHEAVDKANRSIKISPPDATWIPALQEGEKRASTLLGKMSMAKKAKETSGLKDILTNRMREVSKGQMTMARALGYGDRDLVKVFDNGAALMNGNQPKRAEKIFSGLVELDGGVPLFHLALATAREISGDTKGAQRAYAKAVEQARQIAGGADLLADALLKRARFRYGQGSWKSVLADVEDALGLPKSALDKKQRRRALRLKKAAEDRRERRRKRKEKRDLLKSKDIRKTGKPSKSNRKNRPGGSRDKTAATRQNKRPAKPKTKDV
jgi:tetratricopeptide (TPR) repeat protein